MKSKSSSQLPPVSSRHLDRLKGLLAKTEGTVALGGRSDDETRFDIFSHFSRTYKSLDGVKRFMEPTIVTGVTWEDPLMQVTIISFHIFNTTV